MAETTPKQKFATVEERHKYFARRYFEHWNGAKAAREAGYSENSAAQEATRLLTYADVQAELARLAADSEQRGVLTREKVERELAIVGFSDISELAGVESLENLQEKPEHTRKIVKRIKRTTRFNKETGDESTTVELETHDKVAALNLAAKSLGMLKDTVQLTGEVSVNVYPPGVTPPPRQQDDTL
jgi:phage terminase small subunit